MSTVSADKEVIQCRLFNQVTSGCVQVSNNHYRTNNFFDKIGKIINIFKADIINFFSNQEIFQIFQENKRLLLYLIDEKIMVIDKAIFDIIAKRRTNDKDIFNLGQYYKYFFTEMKPFIDEKSIKKILNLQLQCTIQLRLNIICNKRFN